MIPRLQSTLFEEEKHLAALQDFDCGSGNYAVEIADWIKNKPPDGVLNDLRKYPTLRVWIYTLDENTIVGFGSLQKARWRLRESGEAKKRVSILLIPYVGIKKEFHGQPMDATDKFDRYSSQILDDLVGKAKTHRPARHWLGLYVHPENLGAIKLYQRHEFKRLDGIGIYHKDFRVRYPTMLLDLDKVRL